MQDVAGKVAFVTGGASGIGLGIAQALLEAGAKVAIADIRADHLDEARHLLAAHAGRTRFIELDITNRAAFAAAADETEQALGVVGVGRDDRGQPSRVFFPRRKARQQQFTMAAVVIVAAVVTGVWVSRPPSAAIAMAAPEYCCGGVYCGGGAESGLPMPKSMMS